MALDATTFNNVSVMKDSKTDADTGIIVNTYYDAATFDIVGVENIDGSGNTLFKSEITADTIGFSAAADKAGRSATTPVARVREKKLV